MVPLPAFSEDPGLLNSVHFHWCFLVPSTKTKGGPLWPPSIWLHLQSPGKRAGHRISSSYQCGDGRGRLTGQNKGRQTRRQLLHQMTPAFDFAACTIHLTTPANRPSRRVTGGDSWWGKESKGIIQTACPWPVIPSMCVDCASLFSSFTSPRCHGVKGRGMLPPGFPNPSPCQVTYASLPCPQHSLGRSSTNICCPRSAPRKLPLHQMTGPVGKTLFFLPLLPAHSLGSQGPALSPSDKHWTGLEAEAAPGVYHQRHLPPQPPSEWHPPGWPPRQHQ